MLFRCVEEGSILAKIRLSIDTSLKFTAHDGKFICIHDLQSQKGPVVIAMSECWHIFTNVREIRLGKVKGVGESPTPGYSTF
jgi:hypothetical protein